MRHIEIRELSEVKENVQKFRDFRVDWLEKSRVEQNMIFPHF